MRVYSTCVDVEELNELVLSIFEDFNKSTTKHFQRIVVSALAIALGSSLAAVVCGVALLCWLDDYLCVAVLIVLGTVCVVVVFNVVRWLLAKALEPLVRDTFITDRLILAYKVSEVLEALQFVSQGQLRKVRYYSDDPGCVLIEIKMPTGLHEKVCRLPEEMITKCKDEDVLDFSWLDGKMEELNGN